MAERMDAIHASLRADLTAAFDGLADKLIRNAIQAMKRDRASWVEDHALLDDDDAARLLGVTLDKLAELRMEDLPFLRIGRRVRYEREALMGWVRSRVVAGEGRP